MLEYNIWANLWNFNIQQPTKAIMQNMHDTECDKYEMFVANQLMPIYNYI